MAGNGFALDRRLAADSAFVADMALCQVRLMEDARFAWLALIPRRAGLVELADLEASDRSVLMEEAVAAGEAIRAVRETHKLNTAALGNQVRQLHVHVIGRTEGDAAWPGPVWGVGAPERYDDASREALIAALKGAL